MSREDDHPVSFILDTSALMQKKKFLNYLPQRYRVLIPQTVMGEFKNMDSFCNDGSQLHSDLTIRRARRALACIEHQVIQPKNPKWFVCDERYSLREMEEQLEYSLPCSLREKVSWVDETVLALALSTYKSNQASFSDSFLVTRDGALQDATYHLGIRVTPSFRAWRLHQGV